MVAPDLEIELDTRIAMEAGRLPEGGGVLLPGSVVQLTPHAVT